MATMTDKAARDIAEKTIKKYESAGRKIFIILENGDKCWGSGTMDNVELAEATLNLIFELTGDDAEAFFKDAIKQAKQLKKAEAKNAKRKNRA